MNQAEYNKSENSIDYSVARSSSGVSTQVSADGVFTDRDNECQILYGNLFSKLPHPEVHSKTKPRTLTSSSFTNYNGNDNCSVYSSTLDRSLMSSDSKTRRHSEAQTRTFTKRKSSEKRQSASEDLSDSSRNIQNLLLTLNDIREFHSPTFFNDTDGWFFRNPQVAHPSGDIQLPILSATPLGDLLTTDLLETLFEKAENHPKELFFSVLDGNSKIVSNSSLTYSKLFQKAKRISCYITSKLSNSPEGCNVRPGQSVGLVFPADDAVDFVIAFFACLLSKVIAVPAEKPSTTQLLSSGLTGKYLNQLGVSVVLTNTNCFKEISRKGNDVKEIPQWKDICWVTIDSFFNEKISKNYAFPESCATFDAPLYIEYVYSDQHTLHGVPVSLKSTLHHCQALKTMCRYRESQTILCTDDIRYQTGLWHSVLTALYCGLSTLFLPYSLVKKNPICWLNAVVKNKVKFVVTSSRVFHHSLSIDKKDLSGLDLSHVETLLVSDASVPWINETLELFMQRFQSYGLQPDAVLPCVSKSETLTICGRRRSDKDKPSIVLKLCLESLSYDLIKEIGFDSNAMSMPFDSSGCLLPSVKGVVIRLNRSNDLCRQDEIGEICVASPFSNRTFWMTPDDVSSQYLSVNVNIPQSEETEAHSAVYTRTGLVGFFRTVDGTDNIYIHGSLNNFIEVNGRRFNSDDIIGTVSAVKPLGVLYKARCCVFTVPILDHPRLVVVMEVNNDKFSDDKIYEWISNLLQALLNLHQLSAYCVAVITSNTFPKTLLGDINVNETMIRFTRGALNITHLTMCPQTAIANIPSVNRNFTHNQPFNPMSILAHAMHSQSFASVTGISTPMPKTSSLTEILEWRATHTPDHLLFSVINSKHVVVDHVTCDQLHRKAERIASLLKDKIKSPAVGSVVAIYLNNPLELTYAIYGCYYLGMVPMVLNMVPADSPWLSFNLIETLWACKQAKAVVCLTSAQTIRSLKSRDYAYHVPSELWPPLVDIGESPKKKPITIHTISYPEKQLGFIRLHVGNGGVMSLPGWTHSSIGALCETHKAQNDLVPGTEVAVCLDINTNTGILLNCFIPVYCGHHTFIIPPSIMNTNPDTWLMFLHRKSIKHTFCSELALSQSIYVARYDENCFFIKKPALSLQHLESLIVCVNDRPNFDVIREFLLYFEDNKFGLQTLSIGIDSPWTMGMFIQIPKNSYPRTLYLEKASLRNYRIMESEELNESALHLLELGQPVANATVLIVDCQSKCQKSINQLGELWLSAMFAANSVVAAASQKQVEELYRDVHNVTQYAIDIDEVDVFVDGVLGAKLTVGQHLQKTYVKTGLLGFLRNFGPENQLIVLGRIDDCITLRGFTYFPMEIEAAINAVDPELITQSFVFTESDLLITVIEVRDVCRSDSCFRLIPKLVKSVVENFLLPMSVIQFIKCGQLNWLESRRQIKSLWLHRKLKSVLQFYCL